MILGMAASLKLWVFVVITVGYGSMFQIRMDLG